MRRWVELIVTVPTVAADAVSSWLVDREVPGLVEEADPEDAKATRLRAHVEEAAWRDDFVDELRAFLEAIDGEYPGVAGSAIRRGWVEEEDWAESWKAGFPPIEVGRRLLIHTPWEPPQGSERLPIEIEPAMAFGTGQHASTFGVLWALEDLVEAGRAPGRVLDVGTGSGVLAIAARRFEAASVIAIDVDPIAIEAAVENVARNAVEVDLRIGGLKVVEGRFDTLFANLFAHVIINLAPELAARADADARLITAGVLDRDGAAVAAALEAVGFDAVSERSIEGWTCGVFRRRPR